MRPTRLRRWVRQYGACGVLLAGCFLALRSLWMRRRWECIVAALLLPVLAGLLARIVMARHTPPVALECRMTPAVESEGELDKALLHALHDSNVEAAEQLIARGANVNATETTNGYVKETPLLLALQIETFTELHTRREQIDGLIRLLLDRGANVNVVSINYDTPLTLAICQERDPNDVDWVEPLLDRGANVLREIPGCGSTLNLAVQEHPTDLHMAALLLDHGADMNMATCPEYDTEIQDLTPLLSAISKQGPYPGNVEMAKLLVERGAKTECHDRAGKTPLLWAAYYGQIDLMQLLLAHGANLRAEDGMGQTALMLAQEGNHSDAVAFLRSRGLTDKPAAAIPMNALHHVLVSLPVDLESSFNEKEPVTFELGAGLIIRQHGKQIGSTVAFEDLFTSTSLWEPNELNTIRYQMARGFYSPDSYRFFGLVTAHDRSYLGMLWYSPAASRQDQIAHVVFGLRLVGHTLELEVVKKSDMGISADLTNDVNLPRLEKSPQGDMILVEPDGRYRYLPDGSWTKIAGTPVMNGAH